MKSEPAVYLGICVLAIRDPAVFSKLLAAIGAEDSLVRQKGEPASETVMTLLDFARPELKAELTRLLGGKESTPVVLFQQRPEKPQPKKSTAKKPVSGKRKKAPAGLFPRNMLSHQAQLERKSQHPQRIEAARALYQLHCGVEAAPGISATMVTEFAAILGSTTSHARYLINCMRDLSSVETRLLRDKFKVQCPDLSCFAAPA